MRSIALRVMLLCLPMLRFYGQTTSDSSPKIQTKFSSNITQSFARDSAFQKIVLKGAHYDLSKNGLPYFIATKYTSNNEILTPRLRETKIVTVKEPHQSVIRTYFEKYLSGNFRLEDVSGLSKTKRINQVRIFPFRVNAANEIEELVEYEVNWEASNAAREYGETGSTGFASSSVLASGDWYKIAVTQTGVHKITKAFLSSMGINTSNLDPNKIRVFGNGGKMLPEKNGDFRYDDLQENPVQVVSERSDVLGAADYILFYATGTTEWVKTNALTGLKYRAIKNRYGDTSFYFVNIGSANSKKIESRASVSQAANVVSTSYDYYNYHEEDLVNFGKSGRDFYGEAFDLTTSYTFSWNDGNFVAGDSIIADVSLVAASREISNFVVRGNGTSFGITTPTLEVGATHADYSREGNGYGYGSNSDPGAISINIVKLTQKSVGNLDKLTVNARRSLFVAIKQFQFRDSRISKNGNICSFSLTNPTNVNAAVWNVTNPLNPFIQLVSVTSGLVNFTANADSLNEYALVHPNDYYNPTFVGKVVNQNLHAISQADYLIVAHPMFVKEANRLGAFHYQKEGYTYAVATTDQVYNEFSSGRQDATAIRDFIRMLYTRNINQGKEVRYVLLMGDGSYKNMSRNLVNNSNLIPTYQSLNSLSETQSIATDDFYGLMDPDEGYNAENYAQGKVDVGIGRFTCRTNAEVQAILAKIENYYKTDPNLDILARPKISYTDATESTMGDWRNWLVFLADDDDGAIHMSQSDGLSDIVSSIDSSYNFEKIFLDAYQRSSSPGGYRYLDASEDFVKRLKKGALIFNYTGHGGEVGLTAERMVDLDMINKLDNFNKLPLFITATCEFSRYDDPARTSAGELCLLNPKGGAISMLTTCRIAYSGTNETLNKKMMEIIFTKLPDGTRPALGDIVRKTKEFLGQSYVYANFHLLGDPALTLRYPELKVVTSKLNNTPVSPLKRDTLSALQKITVSGYVTDVYGHRQNGFNGIIYPTVFDKVQDVSCLMNMETSGVNIGTNSDPVYVPFKFKLQKNILYRGKAQVINGDFSFTFIVPKDISFAPGPGKIGYYVTNGNSDGNGYFKDLIVGGNSQNTIADDVGPEVTLFMNDKSFVNGGLTNENPILYADLVDSTGINTVGTGLGHDISVVLDENASKPVVLNDYYEANLNSYQSGRVRYPFEKLSEGDHRLSFKVWDIQNNSSTVYSDFIVAPSAELALKRVLNYPNPFTSHTKFIFQHNQGCNPLRVTVQIYTITGKIVKTIQKDVVCEGAVPADVEWDGKDDFGDKLGRGVYIYKLAILNPENKKAEKIEKLVILN